MNSSILFEANKIRMRFKKDQHSWVKEVTYVTLYRCCRGPKWGWKLPKSAPE